MKHRKEAFLGSLTKGHHSITVTLDHRDPAKPKMYFSDQNCGDWNEFDNKADFDPWLQDWNQPMGDAWVPTRSPDKAPEVRRPAGPLQTPT